MPTKEQLKVYADQLPKIYRDILTAFGRAAEPMRRYMDGMAVELLEVQLANHGVTHKKAELFAALEQLEHQGFLEFDVQELTILYLTPLGEELLEALTGEKVQRVMVPELPKPTW